MLRLKTIEMVRRDKHFLDSACGICSVQLVQVITINRILTPFEVAYGGSLSFNLDLA